jgi:hypothetical protein
MFRNRSEVRGATWAFGSLERGTGSVMVKRFLSLLMACALGAMVASPLLAMASGEDGQESSALHHDDGAPCPDGDSESPCDDGCPCFCCPGHATALYSPASALFATPSRVTGDLFGPSEDALPDGAFNRVFRPPRV